MSNQNPITKTILTASSVSGSLGVLAGLWAASKKPTPTAGTYIGHAILGFVVGATGGGLLTKIFGPAEITSGADGSTLRAKPLTADTNPINVVQKLDDDLIALSKKNNINQSNILVYMPQINALIAAANKKLASTSNNVTITINPANPTERTACGGVSGSMCFSKSFLFGLIKACVCVGHAQTNERTLGADPVLDNLDMQLKVMVLSKDVNAQNKTQYATDVHTLAKLANAAYAQAGINATIEPSEERNCTSDSGRVCASVSLCWGLFNFCRCFGHGQGPVATV